MYVLYFCFSGIIVIGKMVNSGVFWTFLHLPSSLGFASVTCSDVSTPPPVLAVHIRGAAVQRASQRGWPSQWSRPQDNVIIDPDAANTPSYVLLPPNPCSPFFNLTQNMDRCHFVWTLSIRVTHFQLENSFLLIGNVSSASMWGRSPFPPNSPRISHGLLHLSGFQVWRVFMELRAKAENQITLSSR